MRLHGPGERERDLTVVNLGTSQGVALAFVHAHTFLSWSFNFEIMLLSVLLLLFQGSALSRQLHARRLS